MFATLHTKLESAFNKIRGRGLLTTSDIEATMKDVRMALLEADVQFKVAKDFCTRVAEKAVGESVLKALSPAQQVIKLVHEELIRTMGDAAVPLNLNAAPPVVIMLVGLQGSGKTTTTAKLGRLLKAEYRRRPLLVPADVYRLAAIQQLQTLGKQYQIDVFESSTTDDPVAIAERAIEYARGHGFDTVVIDTAGRLHIDAELMGELQEISAKVEPHEILLVADGMTGQEAVNVAEGFDKALEIDGLILTKLDGDARGGAALSMRAVTGKPIKFIGLGEKADALEVFHPDRMASRILGMGDVLGLIEKASKEVTIEDSLSMMEKLKKNEFSLEDFLGQLRMIKRLGNVQSLTAMIPGMSKMADKIDPEKAEKEMKRIEAIIQSMTPGERKNYQIINGGRRRRIAKGSGTTVEEVNKLLKQFGEMKKMMAAFSKMGMGGLAKMFGGAGGLGALMKGR